MKKITKILTVFSIVSVFAVASTKAQIIVRARLGRPHGVVVVRGPRPSPRHVWVAEEWTPAGGTYAYHAGYWAVPPRDGGVWIPGHWADRPRGVVWVPGHWR
jgi:hypothetical protein